MLLYFNDSDISTSQDGHQLEFVGEIEDAADTSKVFSANGPAEGAGEAPAVGNHGE